MGPGDRCRRSKIDISTSSYKITLIPQSRREIKHLNNGIYSGQISPHIFGWPRFPVLATRKLAKIFARDLKID